MYGMILLLCTKNTDRIQFYGDVIDVHVDTDAAASCSKSYLVDVIPLSYQSPAYYHCSYVSQTLNADLAVTYRLHGAHRPALWRRHLPALSLIWQLYYLSPPVSFCCVENSSGNLLTLSLECKTNLLVSTEQFICAPCDCAVSHLLIMLLSRM